jgi:outer membrane receptor for monomeric catechols
MTNLNLTAAIFRTEKQNTRATADDGTTKILVKHVSMVLNLV